MIDTVLQEAITEKWEELQALTRLSGVYAAQEELLSNPRGITDLPTLQKLITLKQEELGMYGLLCGTTCTKDSVLESKKASRGDGIHTPMLAFLQGTKGEPRDVAQKNAADFILAIPKRVTQSGNNVPQELQHILSTLDPLDKPVAIQMHALLTTPPSLHEFVKKTVYNVDKTKEEYVEKALSGFAEMISLAIHRKRELNELASEGFIRNFMTNAHLLNDSIIKL